MATSVQDLRDLDVEPFFAPEDLAKLKKIQRYPLALPTSNISRNGLGLKDSVRFTIHEFLTKTQHGDKSLGSTLRWLLFRQWTGEPGPTRMLRRRTLLHQ